LKGYDISLFCDIIEKSSEKESIYNALNLEIPKKKKMKIANKKENKGKKKIPLKEFMKEHFSII